MRLENRKKLSSLKHRCFLTGSRSSLKLSIWCKRPFLILLICLALNQWFPVFLCLLPNYKMASMWKGLSCLESSLETYSLLWVRSTSWTETMQNIYAGSRVASEWELCPEHQWQITEDWQWTLWLPLTVLVLGVENWAAVTISGSELFLLPRWGRPVLAESAGIWSSSFCSFPGDRRNKIWKNPELLLSSLVCDIHQAAAEHMQEGRGCVDRAKVSIFLEQAAYYQCTELLSGHRYYYLTQSKTTVKKRSKKNVLHVSWTEFL